MELHNYQKEAVEKIITTKKIGLFFEMGIGKTAIVLTAIQKLINIGKVNKVIVLAPKLVAQNVWSVESEKWTLTLDICIVSGSAAKRKKLLDEHHNVYVISRDLTKWLKDNNYFKNTDMLVIDESSAFKNASTQRFKSIKYVSQYMKYVVLMSGTPINNYIDIWSQVYLLDGGMRLGKYITKYKQEYFIPRLINGYLIYNDIKENAKEIINDKIKDICISMKTQDYVELPKLIINDIKIKLGKASLDTYKKMKKTYTVGEVTAMNAGVVCQKLMQISSGFLYDEKGQCLEFGTEKIDMLKEIIENVDKQVIVFCTFKRNKELLSQLESSIELSSDKNIMDFLNGKYKVGYAHCSQAGYGINLQSATSNIIFLDIPWSNEMYLQAVGRVYRQGQEHTVVVNRLVADGTIDERICNVLAEKESFRKSMMEAVKMEISG